MERRTTTRAWKAINPRQQAGRVKRSVSKESEEGRGSVEGASRAAIP